MAILGFVIATWAIMGISCALFGGLFNTRVSIYSGKHVSK